MNKLVAYLQGSREELAKVVWPDRKTTTNHTIIVIALSLFVAIVLGAVDYLLSQALTLVVK